MSNVANSRVEGVVRVSVGNRMFYFGTIGSDKLKNISFVPVIEASSKTYLNEEIDRGYQRPASPARMRAFMKFLREHPDSVIPPILLSSRGQWSFKPDSRDSAIGSLQVQGRAAIIDGQHRLGGYVALYEKHSEARIVSFIVTDDLTEEEEKREFIVVNNSQKGVPRALTEFLRDSEEAQIAWHLNEDPDSPFCGRIARTGMKKQHLFALHSVAKQMKELFKMGGLEELDIETKVSFAEQFFYAIQDALPTEWMDIEKLDDDALQGRKSFEYKLLELTGLIAWTTVGKSILHRCYSEGVGMNWERVKELVAKAGQVEWEKEGQYAGRTGSAGARVIVKDMERLLGPETGGEE